MNMPQKIHHTKKPPPRAARSVVKDLPLEPALNKWCYNSFSELCKRVHGLKSITKWNLQEPKDRIILKKSNHLFLLPEIELMIDDSLGYTISTFGWHLPEDHDLYGNNLRSVTKITVSNLVKDLEKSYIRPGVNLTERCHDVLPHVIPKLSGDHCLRIQAALSLMKNFGGPKIAQFCWRKNICSVIAAPGFPIEQK